MDAQDQSRVFETIQTKFDIQDITPEAVNEFLKNKPGRREYTWQERRKSGKLRTRTRIANVKFSNKKDEIANDIGKISSIYDNAKDVRSKGKYDTVNDQYQEFKTKWVVTSVNDTKVRNRLLDSVQDYFRDLNFNELKTVPSFGEATIDSDREAQINNSAISEARELRDSKDLDGLIKLKSDIEGQPVDQTNVDAIDNMIDKLRG